LSKNQTVITSDRIDYYGDKKTAIANNNLTIVDNSDNLKASRGEYNTETKTGLFRECLFRKWFYANIFAGAYS